MNHTHWTLIICLPAAILAGYLYMHLTDYLWLLLLAGGLLGFGVAPFLNKYGFGHDPESQLSQLRYEKRELKKELELSKLGIEDRDKVIAEQKERISDYIRDLFRMKDQVEKCQKSSGNAQEAAKRMKEIQELQKAESKRLLAMALNPSSTDEQRQAALQQLHEHLHHPPAHKGRIKREKGPRAREKAVA